jgi:hypothetical protein
MTENERLQQQHNNEQKWLQWGPYLSERQWGTVREDYSEGGESWSYLSHEDAPARTYRWGEDGLAGISDDTQTLCFAVALWNGQDDRLKERLFGLTNGEGNHGEDVKELYYYLDNTPTHSYQKFLYKYPQAAFPYQQLREKNAELEPTDPEFELLDTGLFDENRYFDVVAEYAKASPTDLLVRLIVSNRGPEAAPLHLLPTLWFRNRWTFGVEEGQPEITRQPPASNHHSVLAHHDRLGDYTLYFQPTNTLLLTNNETNSERIFGTPNAAGSLVKDAFHTALLPGGPADHASRTAEVGTKAAPVYELTIGPGETVEIRLRLSTDSQLAEPLGNDFANVFADRLREADEFYAPLLADSTPEVAAMKRQAWAGVLWSKQYYNYDVARWLKGDPGQPKPPAGRGEVRNDDWPDFKAEHIILMPDKWEYPWFAAWDLVFHCLALAPVDLKLAKEQCLLLAATPHFAKPDGWIPSYEFDFSNTNPPVQGQSAWLLYEYGKNELGESDLDFLRQALQAFLPNHNWWMERFHRHPEESFKGSFLGLDNASLLNREEVPGGGYLKQVDSLSWLAGYTLYLMRAALELVPENAACEELAIKLFHDFEEIGGSLAELAAECQDDPELSKTGFHYDMLVEPDGQRRPVPMRSILGLAPLFGKLVLERHTLAHAPAFVAAVDDHLTSVWAAPRYPTVVQSDDGQRWLFSLMPRQKLEQVIPYLFSEEEMLAPSGFRSLSKAHLAQPASMEVAGETHTATYTPGESDTNVMGGNSNWRGPVWLPLNFVLLLALNRLCQFYGDTMGPVELPTGSGNQVPLSEAVAELARRMQTPFLPDAEGRRPAHGNDLRYATDPHFRDLLLFHEYFDGDTGRGCGASHQTGWTALITLLGYFTK